MASARVTANRPSVPRVKVNPRGHLVVGIALPRHLGDEIAQPVGNPLAADLLGRLDDVRVVADHQVDVRRGEQPVHRLDLGRRRLVLVLHAAVQADDDELRPGGAGAGGAGEEAADVRDVLDVDRPRLGRRRPGPV
jgi:hypothetical protein